MDYIFISSNLQETINTTEKLPSLSTDHSPVSISICKNNEKTYGCGFWKFNCSLVSDEIYIEKVKELIENLNSQYDSLNNAQLKWEFFKYKVRKYSIGYTKNLS